jgi:PAS domain S-box-containing protein
MVEAQSFRTQALLQAIGQISSDPIYAKDVDGRFLYVNPAALAIIGKSADDVLGHMDSEWHSDPEQAAIVMANDRRIMRAGIPEVIEETWDASGLGTRTFRSTKAPFYLDDGSLIGVVCLSADITRLRGVEAQLRQAKVENEFHLLAEALPQIVWITRADGWNVYFNQKWVEYTGLTLEESYGHGWSKSFHPEDQQQAWESWRQAITNNKTYSLECRLRRADGNYRWWLVRGMPLINDDGTIEKWFGTCTDIHDLVQRQQVESDLRAAKAEADRTSLAKSKFIAAASHDLRQPVQSLTLLLSAMERLVADKPKAVNLVNLAKASMASLSSLLTGILDISRLDAGVVAPVMASVDLGELIDQMAREYAPRAEADGLVLRHAPRALRARTDVALLERILRNLIENALRYTAKGGVLIGVRQRGRWVRLDVIDTGIGIAAEYQTEIFEEFRQLNNPARDSSKGLGLGLAIVSRLARLIDSEVQVASRLDHGTRFSLLLPLELSAPPSVGAAPAFDEAGGRILIIEDNSGIRQAYEIMLKDWGYETLSAASGEEALDCAAQAKWEFDAIIADHRLGPGLTGNVAAEEIARRAGRSFPTMLVTGDTAEERLTEVSSCGFAILHKPVEADDLRRTLAALLRGEER